jgi:hypothetical protein
VENRTRRIELDGDRDQGQHRYRREKQGGGEEHIEDALGHRPSARRAHRGLGGVTEGAPAERHGLIGGMNRLIDGWWRAHLQFSL